MKSIFTGGMGGGGDGGYGGDSTTTEIIMLVDDHSHTERLARYVRHRKWPCL